jgi:hypothetical protein
MAVNVKRELALLRAAPGKARAALLKQPPSWPSRAQLAVLRRLAQAGGRLAAEDVHYRSGLVMPARRWVRLADGGGGLVYSLTEAGRDVLKRLDER